MIWLYWSLTILVFIFGATLLVGAPYVPTLDVQRKDALKLLNLKKGETLLELGSGDGRMLVEAAKRGIKSVGIEINPILYLVSLLVTFKYRNLAKVKFGNFWMQRLPDADGIYVFSHANFLARLHKKITQENSNSVKVVSYAFRIPGVKHTTEKSGLFLYTYYNKK